MRQLLNKSLLGSILLLLSACIFDSGKCDDCSAVADKFMKFVLVDENGDCLSPCNRPESSADSKIRLYSLDKDGDRIFEEVNRFDKNYYVNLRIGISDTFYLEYSQSKDTLIVLSEEVEFGCPECSERNIVQVNFNESILCGDDNECSPADLLIFPVD